MKIMLQVSLIIFSLFILTSVQSQITLEKGTCFDVGCISGNGKGIMTWPDDSKYEGDFKDGKINGQGIYTRPDRSKYVGQFKDNKPHGDVIEYRSDGSISRQGRWENGEYIGKIKNEKPIIKKESIEVKTILTQYEEWVQIDPETITWKYVFGKNKFSLYQLSLEYLKNIAKDNDSGINTMIIIGTYHVKDNIIYLDNGNNEKESYFFKGKDTVSFYDTRGIKQSQTGYYFTSTIGSSTVYMASKKSTIEKNDIIIKKLSELLK